MYAKASPFSLALAMLVQDQVLSLLMISELKFLQKKKGQNQDEAYYCLVLPHASNGPGECLFSCHPVCTGSGVREWELGVGWNLEFSALLPWHTKKSRLNLARGPGCWRVTLGSNY